MSEARIMIVEDERVVAEDIKEGLQNMGYAVTSVARSGEMAIKMAEKDRPDLVLMDIILKGEKELQVNIEMGLYKYKMEKELKNSKDLGKN